MGRLTAALTADTMHDERMPLLVQLPGFSVINNLTVVAAVGDISRFEDARHLVGYTGLGASVHDSGQLHRTGRITQASRRHLRAACFVAKGVPTATKMDRPCKSRSDMGAKRGPNRITKEKQARAKAVTSTM